MRLGPSAQRRKNKKGDATKTFQQRRKLQREVQDWIVYSIIIEYSACREEAKQKLGRMSDILSDKSYDWSQKMNLDDPALGRK